MLDLGVLGGVGIGVPIFGHQVIIFLFGVHFDIHAAAKQFLIGIAEEVLSKILPLIAATNLLSPDATGFPIEFGDISVPPCTFLRELPALFDPVISVRNSVPFGRHVVGQIP